MKYLLLFCLSFSSLFSLHINEAVHLRTKQYDSSVFHKIVIYTPPRTGSTLIYNLCRFLFEETNALQQDHANRSKKVYKTHTFRDVVNSPTSVVIFSVRDPLDACFSSYKASSDYHHSTTFNRTILDREVNFQIGIWNSFPLVKKSYHHLLLRYEDFQEDIEPLLRSIEEFFSIEIHPVDVELIKQSLSKESVIASTEKLQDFSGSDKASGFHGHHISPKSFTDEEETYVRYEIYKKLLPHRQTFENLGYDLIDPRN